MRIRNSSESVTKSVDEQNYRRSIKIYWSIKAVDEQIRLIETVKEQHRSIKAVDEQIRSIKAVDEQIRSIYKPSMGSVASIESSFYFLPRICAIMKLSEFEMATLNEEDLTLITLLLHSCQEYTPLSLLPDAS